MKKLLLAAVLSSLLLPWCRAAENSESISCGTSWYPEGGDRAPVWIEPAEMDVDGQKIPAVKMTFLPAKGWNKIFLKVDSVNLREYNTVAFRGRLETPPGLDSLFSFSVLDSKGNWASPNVGKQLKKLPGGDFVFQWDILNQPNIVRGFQAESFNRLALGYPFSKIPEGKTVVLTVGGVKLLKGMIVKAGNPAEYARWRSYISSLKPDYSDSSSALLPPATGRLAHPLPLAGAEIVLPEKSSAPEEIAAQELQSWIRKITGRELKILAVPSADANVKLFLGRACAEKLYPEDVKKLEGRDGFAVRNSGKNIYIFGSIPKGTLNGVFAFLENNSDLILARPNADYGAVYTRNPNLSIVWADALEIPRSSLRGWLQNAGGGGADFPIWAVRNRCNYVGGVPSENLMYGNFTEFGGGHNLQTFIPKDDPAFYPVVKGVKPEKLSIWKHQICMNAPNLADVYAENVIKYIREKAPPGIQAVNIKIEDNWGVCECPKCTAPLKLPDGRTIDSTHPAFRSTQFYDFLNRVTKKINATYPDLKVHTYGYFFTAVPPEIKLNPNITVLFCPYVRKDHRTPLSSPINDHWYRVAEGLAAKGDVIVREYYGILSAGRPLAEVAAWDVRDYLSRGTDKFAAEIMPDGSSLWWDGAVRGAAGDWDFNMMDFWVITRLYWNPDANVETLRKYFMRRTFHEAAPEMERFFGMIRSAYYQDSNPTDWMSGPQLVALYLKSKGKVAEAEKLLETALAKTGNPESRLLIARIRNRLAEYLSPKKEVPKEKRSRSEQMILAWDYGWRPVGKNAQFRRTVIEHNGKFVPALHLIFRNVENAKAEIRTVFAFDVKDVVFRFTIVPGKDVVQHPDFLLLDSASKTGRAPDSAFRKEADGSWRMDWKPSAEGAFNPASVRLAVFACPAAKLPPGGTVEFYIIQSELEINGTTVPAESIL